MAFLDETGLETLWGLVKERVATGTITGATSGTIREGSVSLPSEPKLVIITFLDSSNVSETTPIIASTSGKYLVLTCEATSASSATSIGAYQVTVTMSGTTLSLNWNRDISGTPHYTVHL